MQVIAFWILFSSVLLSMPCRSSSSARKSGSSVDQLMQPDVLVDPAGDSTATKQFGWPLDNLLTDGTEPRQRIDFSEIERKMIVDMHNAYRSNATPHAADMTFLDWDYELSSLASRWALRCVFRHGFPSHGFQGGIGQNLYRGWDRSGYRAVRLWHDSEAPFYDYYANTCNQGQVCGHYTQVMWAESRRVGCGAALCGKEYLIVCHYYPSGNAIGFRPYKLGKPCSQCALDNGGFCSHRLCMAKKACSRTICDCPLECLSCGRLNRDTCTCSCKSGWDTLDCSWPCMDVHEWCGQNPGWPTPASSCSLMGGAVQKLMCRKMCGMCAPLSNKSSEMCCDGKQCPFGHALDDQDCSCMALHSSYVIHAASSRTLPGNILYMVQVLLMSVILRL